MAGPVTPQQPEWARIGSDEWFESTSKFVRNSIKATLGDCRPVAHWMPHFREYLAKRGGDWVEFCRTKLDTDPAFLETIERGIAILERRGYEGPIQKAVALEAAGELKPHGTNQHGATDRTLSDNVHAPARQGTSSDYLLARLKRDAPDVAQQWVDGAFKSVRAAAIAAGIVKPADPMTQARRALLKLTPAQRVELLRDVLTSDEWDLIKP